MAETPSLARQVAGECQSIARQLADHQQDGLTLSGKNVTRLVNALLNAGNFLERADRFDPFAAAAGWTRKNEFGPDGRLIVVFEQDLPTPDAPPPPPTGYGHPEVR